MYTDLQIEEFKEQLQGCLSQERYLHSLGTMRKAIELAKRFNCDENKAKVAGLLHDCAKCLTKEDLQVYFDCFEEDEKCSCKTWHAPAGVKVAIEQFGIEDNEILSAIRWHTIGKKDMSDLEKIVFIADKIEDETREDELRLPIKKVLDETNSLDMALLKSFELTIVSLVDRKLPICYRTIDVYNYLLSKKTK